MPSRSDTWASALLSVEAWHGPGLTGLLLPSQHAQAPSSLGSDRGGLSRPCLACCFCAPCSRAAGGVCSPWRAGWLSPRTLNTLFLGSSGSLRPPLRANVSEGALAPGSQVLHPLVEVIALGLQRSAQLLQPLDFHLQAFQLFVPEGFLGREMKHSVRQSLPQVWAA